MRRVDRLNQLLALYTARNKGWYAWILFKKKN